MDRAAGIDHPLDPRRCGGLPPVPTPARAALEQRLRGLLKRGVVNRVSRLLAWLGRPLQTVQVLCIDRAAGLVLVLRTRAFARGVSPVQGLRVRLGGLFGGRDGDARADARRELGEEAVTRPPDLDRFRLAVRYREGPQGQFDCRVYVVDCDSAELPLRAETGEGLACWMPLGEAVAVFANPVLRAVLGAVLEGRDPAASGTGGADPPPPAPGDPPRCC